MVKVSGFGWVFEVFLVDLWQVNRDDLEIRLNEKPKWSQLDRKWQKSCQFSIKAVSSKVDPSLTQCHLQKGFNETHQLSLRASSLSLSSCFCWFNKNSNRLSTLPPPLPSKRACRLFLNKVSQRQTDKLPLCDRSEAASWSFFYEILIINQSDSESGFAFLSPFPSICLSLRPQFVFIVFLSISAGVFSVRSSRDELN